MSFEDATVVKVSRKVVMFLSGLGAWLTPVIQHFGRAEPRGDHEVKRSRPSWPTR
uniref:Uncharacterized protein n=1 Tax=Astyanax mexicanus TaxID=7994 RepID=A0A3B1JIR0_ASTMX